MCGIAGCYLFNPGAVPPNWHQTMDGAVAALEHRGPDSAGSWSNERIYLGMRRLSIIDIQGGSQPIWNENKECCIVFNGELYNHRDLRPILEGKGHRFGSDSDTEVIIHAYEEWGCDCMEHLLGMFAFAIWDIRKRQLLIARDRIGEKPLYYYTDSNRLLFASEIKAILSDPSVPREIAPRGMSNYFGFGHAVAPETMYKGIKKLLPGHFLLIKDEELKISEYWDVGQGSEYSPSDTKTKEDWQEEVLILLEDSVKRRMVADVPLGAFLSGGVDSSAVVALMCKYASTPVQTFSLGFSIGGAYNELSDARKVAEALHTEHHELLVEHCDLVSTLQTLVYHYDEPFGDAASFPLYLLSKFARQHVKVALSGDGGDELFGGYRRYSMDRIAPFYQLLPSLITEKMVPALVERFHRFRRVKRVAHTLPIKDPARRYASWLCLFTPEMQEELFDHSSEFYLSDYDPAWPYPHYYHKLRDTLADDHLNRLMYTDLKTWLVDTYMEKTDKASMACSLETRLPLLDHRLVDLAFCIPGNYKIRGLQLKKILKNAVAELVPGFVLNKPKHGFAVPTDPWFRGDLKEFTYQVLLDERTRSRGYFQMDYIERLWKEHVEGRHVWDSQLWLLLNFELWHRMYLDGDGI